MSMSQFNSDSRVTQAQMQSMRLNSFSVAIDTMLNFDGDANTGVKCE